MRIGYVLVLLYVTLPVTATAQIAKVDPKIFSQELTPVNPDVANLGAYTMAPPSFSNGLPQQNIPLFEIKENGITYPVNLFYNYSGFKVKEEASSVGLGWGLTDGMIMRIVKHLPDDHTGLLKKFGDFGDELTEEWGLGILNSYFYTNPANATSQYSYTQNRLFYKLYDGQPDLYIYNYGGHTGKFLWVNNAAIKLDHNDVVIGGESLAGHLTFTITTTDGNRATFTEADKINTNPVEITRPRNCNPNAVVETYMDYGNYTAWRVQEIRNLTTQAKITFRYVTNVSTQEINIHQLTSLTLAAPQRFDGSYFTTDFQKDETYRNTTTISFFPQEIESDNYKVVFTTKSRSDGGEYRIDSIRIFNKLNLLQPVKTIAFTQSYFGSTAATNTCWLKLKKINITGGGNDKEYTFSYVQESQNTAGMNKEGLSIDHWGYFNNATNATLVPLTGNLQSQLLHESSLNTGIISWANRDPDYTYARSFSLDTVFYPTGGFTHISYQSADGKGIRVISQEDNDGKQSLSRYYDYGIPPGSTFTITPNYQFDQYYTYQCCGSGAPPSTRITTYSSGQFSTPEFFQVQEAFYDTVTEYIGTPDGRAGRTMYTYAKLYGLTNESLLTGTFHYKYGSNIPVASEKLYYSATTLKTIHYWQVPELSSTGLPSGPCAGDPFSDRNTCCPSDSLINYILGDMTGGVQSTYAFWLRLDSTENINDGVKQRKVYKYHPVDVLTGLPKHTLPTETQELLSDGNTRYTYFYYPGDTDPDNSSFTLGLSQMWDPGDAHFKNYIATPIKTKTILNGHLLSKQTNIYTYNTTRDYLLKTGYEALPAGQESGKEQWALSYDDSAKLVNIRKGTGAAQTYIWDYHLQYPIAEVINASADRAAYTSFESDGLGGWTKNAGAAVNYNTAALTGNNTISGGVQKTVPSGNYIVSLWSTANTYVNGTLITQSPKKQVGSWKLYEIKLTGVTAVNVTGDNIDEVRLYPEGSQMTTYTYDPLAGMTSQCDGSNKLTYYEYDAFGRLMHIRDEHKNIIKKMEYQYKHN